MAYKEVFSGPPYYEHYTTEEIIEKVWLPHLTEGLIVIAHSDGNVMGFGCAKPAVAEEEVSGFLKSKLSQGLLTVPIDSMWYMSELGVLDTYRKRGIGMALIARRILLIAGKGIPYYVMRTAAQGSHSQRLYESIGARKILGLQDVSGSDQVIENRSLSTERIYLYGECQEAIANIAANHKRAAP